LELSEKMKHLHARYLWLQESQGKGVFMTKKVPRDQNPSDMMTHSLSANEVKEFCPMIGLTNESEPDQSQKVGNRLVSTPVGDKTLRLCALFLAPTVAAAMPDQSSEGCGMRMLLLTFVLLLLVGMLCAYQAGNWQAQRRQKQQRQTQQRWSSTNPSIFIASSYGTVFHTHAGCRKLKCAKKVLEWRVCKSCGVNGDQGSDDNDDGNLD
jgi:hypothetical protein